MQSDGLCLLLGTLVGLWGGKLHIWVQVGYLHQYRIFHPVGAARGGGFGFDNSSSRTSKLGRCYLYSDLLLGLVFLGFFIARIIGCWKPFRGDLGKRK